jgi:hypothetical protein
MAMNGQYIDGLVISVSYDFREGGSKGQRHGYVAERIFAAYGKRKNVLDTGFSPRSVIQLEFLYFVMRRGCQKTI